MLKKPIQILLIDDETESCKMLQAEARRKRFIVDCFHTLDEGIAHLEQNQKIRAVILDSRCALDDEQNPDSIKTNFVFHAMDQINRIEHEQNRYIPFMVFANNLFDLEKDLDGIAKVISKKQGYDALFKHLDDLIALLPEMIVRDKYAVIFEFIENYLTDDDDDLMETLLMQSEKSDTSSIVTNITLIRRLLEKLFDILAPNILGKPPDNFEQKGKSRTRNIMGVLVANKYLPYELKKSAGNLYSFSSKFGNHNLIGGDNHYFPGKYAVASGIFSLLEIYSWAAFTLDSLPN